MNSAGKRIGSNNGRRSRWNKRMARSKRGAAFEGPMSWDLEKGIWNQVIEVGVRGGSESNNTKPQPVEKGAAVMVAFCTFPMNGCVSGTAFFEDGRREKLEAACELCV